MTILSIHQRNHSTRTPEYHEEDSAGRRQADVSKKPRNVTVTCRRFVGDDYMILYRIHVGEKSKYQNIASLCVVFLYLTGQHSFYYFGYRYDNESAGGWMISTSPRCCLRPTVEFFYCTPVEFFYCTSTIDN